MVTDVLTAVYDHVCMVTDVLTAVYDPLAVHA
jgi:hypothetical protein